MQNDENKVVVKVLTILTFVIALLFVVQLITAIEVKKTATELKIKTDRILNNLIQQVEDGRREREELRLKVEEIIKRSREE